MNYSVELKINRLENGELRLVEIYIEGNPTLLYDTTTGALVLTESGFKRTEGYVRARYALDILKKNISKKEYKIFITKLIQEKYNEIISVPSDLRPKYSHKPGKWLKIYIDVEGEEQSLQYN